MGGIANLDIKQLRVLHLLLIENNVSRVAAQMGLSQQAVSDQLKKLRATFNDRLFIRKSNGLLATPFAKSLEVEVSDIIARLEKLTEPRVFDPAQASSVFTICATDYAQTVILPQLLAELRQRAPKLKVIVTDIEIDNLPLLMDKGEIDLVISFPKFVADKYPIQTLFTETHKCVVSKDHDRAEETWQLAQIAEHPQLIISPKRANLVGSADEYFESFGFTRNTVMTLPFFSGAAECVASTGLLALLPSRLLPHEKLKEVQCNLAVSKF